MLLEMRTVLFLLALISLTTCLQCQNGSFVELENQMSVDPVKTQVCQKGKFCYTKYYNDGQDITYESGCDEDSICHVSLITFINSDIFLN